MRSHTLFYELTATFTPKTPHDFVQNVLIARHMSNRPSAEKNKKSEALQKIASEFLKSESPFEPHANIT